MSVFAFDGITFDMTRSYADVLGVVWHWVGDRNTAGEPLMTAAGGGTLSLPDLYLNHGPLIPLPSPLPNGAFATALRPLVGRTDFEASVEDGFVEGVDEWFTRVACGGRTS
jgi:hypothetical protein